MYRDTVSPRQLATWLCAALIPVLLQLAAGEGWVVASVVVTVCSALVVAVWKWGRTTANRFVCCLQYLYIIVLLWKLLPHTASAWPGDNFPAVPLITLILAAWSACKGAEASARVGCVLFWIVLITYLAVLASGTPEVKLHWLQPKLCASPWNAVVVLLIPGAVRHLQKEGHNYNLRLLLPGAFLMASVIMTAGILSADRTTQMKDPFYTAVQSIDLLRLAQRFEALLSAAMTAGWFSLLTLLLCANAASAQQIRTQWGRPGLWLTVAAAAVGLLCKLHIPWWILAILAAVFWVVVPLLAQGLVPEKKS